MAEKTLEVTDLVVGEDYTLLHAEQGSFTGFVGRILKVVAIDDPFVAVTLEDNKEFSFQEGKPKHVYHIDSREATFKAVSDQYRAALMTNAF